MDQEINGIPLVVVIIATVEWTKRLGLEGKWLVLTSMLVGVLFGTAYKLSNQYPTTAAEWFEAFIYGILLGLIASGIYDSVKNIVVRL